MSSGLFYTVVPPTTTWVSGTWAPPTATFFNVPGTTVYTHSSLHDLYTTTPLLHAEFTPKSLVNAAQNYSLWKKNNSTPERRQSLSLFTPNIEKRVDSLLMAGKARKGSKPSRDRASIHRTSKQLAALDRAKTIAEKLQNTQDADRADAISELARVIPKLHIKDRLDFTLKIEKHMNDESTYLIRRIVVHVLSEIPSHLSVNDCYTLTLKIEKYLGSKDSYVQRVAVHILKETMLHLNFKKRLSLIKIVEKRLHNEAQRGIAIYAIGEFTRYLGANHRLPRAINIEKYLWDNEVRWTTADALKKIGQDLRSTDALTLVRLIEEHIEESEELKDIREAPSDVLISLYPRLDPTDRAAMTLRRIERIGKPIRLVE